MLLKTASALLLLLASRADTASAKCGGALHQPCLGDTDPRYDPDVSSDLKDIHPIWSKYDGHWHCSVNDFDGATSPMMTNYVPADAEARAKHANRPYNLTDVPAFMSVAVDGTRLTLNELRIYSPPSPEFCAGTPDDMHTNVMDDGVCGTNGWAEGGDIVRTSTHNKDEYAVTAVSTGIFSSGGSGHEGHEGHDDHSDQEGHDDHSDHEGHLRKMMNKEHVRRMLLQSVRKGRALQDGGHSHGHGDGGGGGVEHPIHGADGILFAADSSSGDALVYSIKNFAEDYNSFVMRSGSFDLVEGTETRTSQYSCKRAPTKEAFEAALASAYDKAQVTAATRASTDFVANGCAEQPCPTEETICSTDPSCSVSPYQEPSSLKVGPIVGIVVACAIVAIGAVIFVYQRRINALNEAAQSKMKKSLHGRESTRELMNANAHSKRLEMVRIFEDIDTSGDGLISKEELWTHLQSKSDLNIAQNEFNAMWKKTDGDGSGSVDFSEFVALMEKLI